METTFDPVDKPEHYNKGKMEVIQIIKHIVETKESPFEAYLVSNIVKYLCRYEFKGTPLEDLKKAKKYLDFLIQEKENEL